MASFLPTYTADGSATKTGINIKTFKKEDIKVYVDDVEKTAGTGTTAGSSHDYEIQSYTTSSFNIGWVSGKVPTSPSKVRIVRDTVILKADNSDVEGKAVFTAGSSVKAGDLNANQNQALRALEELDDQKIQKYDIEADAVTTTEIRDNTIVNANISTTAAIAGTKVAPDFGSQNIVTTGTASTGNLGVTGNITVTGTVDGRDVATDGSKLDGIEAGATADQTAAQIRTLVESATDSNVFTDADHTKLDGIDVGAKDDQTSTEIKTLLAGDNLTDAHLAANSVGTSEIKDDAVGADQLINTSVTAGSYGGSTAIPSLTVDAQGRLTAVSNNVVSFDVEADTSPSLGGNLDVEDKEIITTTTNQDIILTPNGTGTVTVKGTGSTSGTVEVNTETNAKSIKIQAPTNANLAGNYTLTLPVNDGDNGQFLKTDGLGVLSWDTVSGGGGGGGTAAPNNIVTLSETVDGNRTDFSMSVTPASAQNLIVSVNGVVQKPNAGTTIAGSAEGYCVDGATLKFATAPANGSSIFIIEHAATTASDRIVEGNSNVDIFDDNSTSRAVVNLDGSEKFRVNEGGQIGLGGANYGTDGQVLTSQGSGAAAQWETIPIEVANDTSPQLGGDLDIQARKITTSTTNGYITLEPNGTGVVMVRGAGGNDGKIQLNCSANSHGVSIKSPPHSANQNYTLTLPSSIVNNGFLKTDTNGNLSFAAVNTDLVNDTTPQLGGDLDTNSHHILLDDDHNLKFGNDTDLEIFHDSASTSNMINSHRLLQLFSNGNTSIRTNNNDLMIQCVKNGAVELYYDNTKKFETTSSGTETTGDSYVNGKVLIGTTTEGNESADDLTVHSSTNTGITIRSGTSNNGSIFFSDATSGAAEYQGFIQYVHSEDNLYFGTSSTSKAVIHSAGQFQVGGSSLSSISSFADDLVIGQSGSTAISGLTFCSTNSSGIRFHDTADAGELEFNHSDNSFTTSASGLLKYRTNGSERMRIDSSGKVLIGTQSPAPYSTRLLTVGDTSFGDTAIEIRSTSSTGRLYFTDSDTSGVGSYVGSVQYHHTDDSMRFETGGNTTRLRIDSDGLKFGSDSAAANALDDYEEGTWTPVLQGYTGTQWDNVGYDEALDYTTGNYVKIGSLVYIYFYTGAFSLNSGWNNAYARINGLPYVFRNASPYYGGQFTFTHTNCFKDLSGNLFDCHSAYGVYGQTYINPSIGNTSNQAKWGSEANRYIMVAGTYQTNV